MTNLNLPAKTDGTIRELFESSVIQQQIKRALPAFMTAEKLTRIMLTTFRTNKSLLNCSQQSLLACFFGCAQLGLTPEPWLGQAYLVPFWNSKLNCNEATLIPGYRGLVTLARRTGAISTIIANAVYENEPFTWDRIDIDRASHGFVDGDPGDMKGAYTIWKYTDGNKTGEYMALWEIDKIMNRTKSRNRKGEIVGPWVTDKAEMAKKTVIRRHFKLAPVSIEDNKLSMAVEAENIAITDGPGGQDKLFLPEFEPPEPVYTPDDFDKEFADVNQTKHWPDFWGHAANHHREAASMSEDELKVDIMRAGPDKFREAFKGFVEAENAKPAKPKGDKKQPAKKAPSKTAAATKKKAELKEQADMLASEAWAGCQAYAENYEQLYNEVLDDITGGNPPKTIKECEAIIAECQRRNEVDDGEGIPG